MSNIEEMTETQVRFRKNGDLVQRVEGQEILVAHYDRASGHLEFATKELSLNPKIYQQVTARIGTVAKGTQVSGLTIRSMGVKGEAKPDLKKLPKRPPLGPLGDAAEDICRYYLENDPQQFKIRYGCYLDEKGDFIRKSVRRIIEVTEDLRDTAGENQIPKIWDAANSQSKAPVFRERKAIEKPDGIIARRATALTFIPEEVVGGFRPDDEFENDRISEDQS